MRRLVTLLTLLPIIGLQKQYRKYNNLIHHAMIPIQFWQDKVWLQKMPSKTPEFVHSLSYDGNKGSFSDQSLGSMYFLLV